MEKARLRFLGIAAVIIATAQFYISSFAFAAGATTSLHLVKYDTDCITVLAEKTVDYKWMERNLKIYGDGKTHYYHQGPVFEGDIWDPEEVKNLKDKGAVKGAALKDLCDLVGGMNVNDEVTLISVDKWQADFAYGNIYEPQAAQGTIALCWYNGEDALEGERYGVGYPANNAYRTALQIVFMSEDTNKEGKRVFGNSDMKATMTQKKYQHFFEGQYPSTNGLSGKWITGLRIYSGGRHGESDIELENNPAAGLKSSFPWMPVSLGLVGVVMISAYFFLSRRKMK